MICIVNLSTGKINLYCTKFTAFGRIVIYVFKIVETSQLFKAILTGEVTFFVTAAASGIVGNINTKLLCKQSRNLSCQHDVIRYIGITFLLYAEKHQENFK